MRTILILLLLQTTAAAQNFTVNCPDRNFAIAVERAAEHYRRKLSLDWFGRELPPWRVPCPLDVQLIRGSGGHTSFIVNRGNVSGLEMAVQGDPDQIINAVLPHEVLHSVLISHFRVSLPRWADEGLCSLIEDESARAFLAKALYRYHKEGRFLPIDQILFADRYPSNRLDVHLFYAQSASIVEFLLHHNGDRGFILFLGDWANNGMRFDAIKHHYGYRTPGELQDHWISWFTQGSPEGLNGQVNLQWNKGLTKWQSWSRQDIQEITNVANTELAQGKTPKRHVFTIGPNPN